MVPTAKRIRGYETTNRASVDGARSIPGILVPKSAMKGSYVRSTSPCGIYAMCPSARIWSTYPLLILLTFLHNGADGFWPKVSLLSFSFLVLAGWGLQAGPALSRHTISIYPVLRVSGLGIRIQGSGFKV